MRTEIFRELSLSEASDISISLTDEEGKADEQARAEADGFKPKNVFSTI